eukprot:TRINITY_DN25057_c0_g1_i1.p1 TRINITY_DN25057_c0_g1~~TRINITY_DN25057_c0_g1_i1.p1  ORF type:complete len:233 (+),score=53.81 TRINITY_DN25057_c0_g1_i1:52-750(+)
MLQPVPPSSPKTRPSPSRPGAVLAPTGSAEATDDQGIEAAPAALEEAPPPLLFDDEGGGDEHMPSGCLADTQMSASKRVSLEGAGEIDELRSKALTQIMGALETGHLEKAMMTALSGSSRKSSLAGRGSVPAIAELPPAALESPPLPPSVAPPAGASAAEDTNGVVSKLQTEVASLTAALAQLARENEALRRENESLKRGVQPEAEAEVSVTEAGAAAAAQGSGLRAVRSLG